MVVVPLAGSETEYAVSPVPARKSDSQYWVRVAAAGSLAASGALLMSGKRRAGLALAITGTVFTLIDQKETVCAWWNRLPGYLEETQSILARVQGAGDEISAQGERLRSILSR